MKAALNGLAVLALTGCANLDSIYRPIAVGSTQSPQAVTTDIKQRVIISSPRARRMEGKGQDGATDVIFCPEPSPESLSAYGNSAGISGNRGTGAVGQAAIASAETAGFVGLRTQSIQLLREDKFAICLAYLNNGITSGEYYDLQRRSQNFTLGILAIEQLTGTIKADQVALGTTAGAGGGSDDAEKESANLDAAKAEQNEATKNFEKGRLDLEVARSEVKPLVDRVAAAEKTLANLPAGADEATKTNAQANVEKERTALATKRLEVARMEIDVAALQRSVSIADAKVAAAQSAMNLALSRVRATASGVAAFNRSGGISTAVADHISNAAVTIVKAVLDESGRGEQCNAVLAALREGSAKVTNEVAVRLVATACPNADSISPLVQDPNVKQILNEAGKVQRRTPEER